MRSLNGNVSTICDEYISLILKNLNNNYSHIYTPLILIRHMQIRKHDMCDNIYHPCTYIVQLSEMCMCINVKLHNGIYSDEYHQVLWPN